MPRPIRLDPDAPIASLLEQTGLSQSELARRLDGPPAVVSAPLLMEREGRSVTLRWLCRLADAAGFRLEIRLIPRGSKKST